MLCEVFEDETLASDPRFATFEARFQNRGLVLEKVQGHFLRKTTAEWLAAMRGKVPCAPVRNITDALADPELELSRAILSVEHPEFGTIREVNTPARFAGVARTDRRAPVLGEDTVKVLKDYLHYADDRIEALRNAGAI